MQETLNYVPAKEGLAALDSFVAKKCAYDDLPPFILPAVYKTTPDSNYSLFEYSLGHQSGQRRYFRFFLPSERLTDLSDTIYVLPQRDNSRGQNPYYWLDFYTEARPRLPALTSCRLGPGEEKYKIDFKTWHGLAEQLLADYVKGINNLRFKDLLPFNRTVTRQGKIKDFYIAGVTELPTINIRDSKIIEIGSTLSYIPRTDDQNMYEWLDILKNDATRSTEGWLPISSYRILAGEHRIYSIGWFGFERQLLMDRIKGRSGITFENLRPIRAAASGEGLRVLFLNSRFENIRLAFHLKPGLLLAGEETITIPRQDDQKIYEWLELYRFDQTTNRATGEVLEEARITPEGISQQQWLGLDRQLLRDYTYRLVDFSKLKSLTVRVSKHHTSIHLWVDNHKIINLIVSRSFGLKAGDELTLAPEKETEEGTDFLLSKGDTLLARYRLDLKTKKFTCIDNLVIQEQPASVDDWTPILEEYEKKLLSGEIMSYEEFMNTKATAY